MLPVEGSPLAYTLIFITGTALYLLQWFNNPRRNAVPTVGPSAPLLSYLGAARFLYDAKSILDEGYMEYGTKPFRVATFSYWQYIISDPKHIEEIKRAPDEIVSFREAVFESLNFQYSFGLQDIESDYHTPVIRTTLTRNLALLVDETRDEIKAAFTDIIPVTDEWNAMPALDCVTKIVARTSSRIFVGLPLCRDTVFLDLSVRYTFNVVMTGVLLGLAPESLKPAINPIVNTVARLIDRAEVLLSPQIEERRKCMETYGDDWPEKPNDLLQWLMDASSSERPVEQTNRGLATRILVVGFAAIHTTSMNFTNALYRLAAHPEYVQPLRDEVEGVVTKDGWSKASLQRMRKIDSFLKEAIRLPGISLLFVIRKMLQDFTFSDGTFIPKGSYIATATSMTHDEAAYYPNPQKFDPWRFSDMSDETEEGTQHQMVNPSVEYLPFGLGKHACPGRFFAAIELKSMLAHLVTTYDVALEEPGNIPKPVLFGISVSPNRKAKVLFRRRRD